MSEDIYIFGLGNPGQEYRFTRHNFGFLALDDFSRENNFPQFNAKKDFLVSDKIISEKNIFLIKPLTFMNLSGKAVKEFLKKRGIFKIGQNEPGDNIVLIHDDLDLAFGSYKIKFGGSGGSHNGVNSVIDSIQSKNFIRLKLGINSDLKKQFDSGADFVLSNFSKEEIKKMPHVFITINEILLSIISDGLEKTMNKFNRR